MRLRLGWRAGPQHSGVGGRTVHDYDNFRNPVGDLRVRFGSTDAGRGVDDVIARLPAYSGGKTSGWT